jgi:hypothetical protein
VQLGFKGMGADTLVFLVINLQQVDNTSFVFGWLVVPDNSFFLSFKGLACLNLMHS